MPDAKRKPRHRSGPPIAREFRRWSAQGLEVRSAGDSDAIIITGIPIAYNAAYTVMDMFGEFEEEMHPGVASNVIAAGCDTRFLFNHDGLPMARTVSGTLTLADTPTGLSMRAALDARQQLASDLAVAIERGDVSQMSCGFVVGMDEWNDDYSYRNIYRLEQLFDVSAVTYPASPTTSVELSLRSMMAQPVESRARIRVAWKMANELRAGKVLSAENAGMLQKALEALHEADDVNIPNIVKSLQTVDAALDAGQEALAAVLDKANPDDDDDKADDAEESSSDQDGTNSMSDDIPPGVEDGTGSRSADTDAENRAAEPDAETRALAAETTKAERRELRGEMTFSDVQEALCNALQARYADPDAEDPYADLWLRDCTDTWVVWKSWEDAPGPGLWQANYVINDGVVTLGDPVQVTVETSYVPVPGTAPAMRSDDDETESRSDDAPAAPVHNIALELEAELMQLRGRGRGHRTAA